MTLSAWQLLVRAKGFRAVFVLALMSSSVAWIGANFSGRQQGVIFFDLMQSGCRVGLLLFSLVWVVELLSKEIDRKSILFQLSFPYSRAGFLVSRFIALAAMLLIGAVGIFVLALVLAPMFGWPLSSLSPSAPYLGYAVSCFGLWLEILVVVAVTLLVATVATSLVFPVVVGLSFAVAGRLIGHVTAYLANGADGDFQLADRFSTPIALIRYILPDLAALDFRAWYLYGAIPDAGLIVASVAPALLYLVATLTLNIVVFERRQFT